ncbi:MAG: hypothetical protein R2568_09370 [Candidatus Scalindua sp.]|jgi:hypothetical protein|nr:hypothetical protein [Candidatus Scalindua sp.]MDV5166939.1 hypothetical protein [Candidatus Scalindua sp.]
MMQEPNESQPEAPDITKNMTTGEVTEKYPATNSGIFKTLWQELL